MEPAFRKPLQRMARVCILSSYFSRTVCDERGSMMRETEYSLAAIGLLHSPLKEPGEAPRQGRFSISPFRLVIPIFCMERCCLPASCQRAVPERRMLRMQQSVSAASVEGTARCLPFLVGITSHQIKHALKRIGAEADDEISADAAVAASLRGNDASS